ncbi:MAG: DUF2279 domain-containing protein [Spirochaetes bacterium]|nr:DUF2279 domain-containing protein [Spirochaetota bacterium]
MKKFLTIIILILLFTSHIASQESLTGNTDQMPEKETVRLPENLYDSFQFDPGTAPYVRYGLYAFGPLFMIGYGLGTWGWNSTNFNFKTEKPFGTYAINAGVDKLGHLYGNYAMKRLTTFMFKASGSSLNKANLEGALLTAIITTAGEIGDGFGPNYGFDVYDLLANQVGILVGFILDYSPFLDRIFTLRWEYFPTKAMREKFDLIEHHDIFTDYSGSKFMLTTKLGGIPYLSLTPLRYVNMDAGYYARGYRPAKGFDRRTRNFYIGLSVNFSIAFGDILPTGYLSSSMQSFFNYMQVPYVNWEAKRWVISDRPQSDWKEEDI